MERAMIGISLRDRTKVSKRDATTVGPAILVSGCGAGLLGRLRGGGCGERGPGGRAQGGGWHVTSEAALGATVCRSPDTRPHTPPQAARFGPDRAASVFLDWARAARPAQPP
ncbi:unnamed protein product, partial [Iphiclides podalirius]